MQRNPIRSDADLHRIESQPYEAFMSHKSVFSALCETAGKFPQRKALTYLVDANPATPPLTWTYEELLADIGRAASLFRELAGGDEPCVAMLLPAIPEAYLTVWGAEAAGVLCPINYLLDSEHIAELIRTARCNVLVALGPNPELDIWSRVPDLMRKCPDLKQILAVGGEQGAGDFLSRVRAASTGCFNEARKSPSQRLAALFHTGGTTGAPKLAQHTHVNQLHSAWSAAQMYSMDERDVVLNGFPLFHVAGSIVYGLSALLSGAHVVLPTLLGLRNTAFVARYWEFVEREAVTLLAAVPTVIAALIGVEPQHSNIGSVRALLTGGSPLPSELAAAFERKFNLPVRNILGMTECAGVVSIEPFLADRTPGSCGLRLPFTEVRALNHAGERCVPGAPGILRLRGPNVGPGYTDARRDSGTFTEDGWLITGDIGHIDEAGRVYVTGRAKDVIIRGGHNIDPQVIEEALLRHPAVLMAAAVGEPDEYAGELPVAFVSLRPGASVDLRELAAFASERIPERPAYPKRITVVPNLPMTAVGKVIKPQLRAMACETALRERLQKAGLDETVLVAVEETSRGLCACFRPCTNGGSTPVERIRDIMRPFAIAYSIEP